jgi:hypothetical protein
VMTTDPDELNYLRIMLAKKRKKNSFWKWPDRPVEERGLATEILRQAGVDVADMRSRERSRPARLGSYLGRARLGRGGHGTD